MKSVYIVNSRGEKELFSFQKLRRSVARAGVPRKLAEEIAQRIEKEIYSGIKTAEIFRKVEELLFRRNSGAASRFNLKEGMRKLGPTGFLFEKFVAEIFKELGFEVKINQHLPGYCLNDYEIDFLARKNNLLYVGECKYRNLPGEQVHLKDVLANHARFHDLKAGPFLKSEGYRNCDIKSIVVTNAKYTKDAIRYCNCSGIDLLGWRYPKNNSLERLIEENDLYPVTVLPSLRGYLKDALVSDKTMLVRDVARINVARFSDKYRISQKLLSPLIEEARNLTVDQKI